MNVRNRLRLLAPPTIAACIVFGASAVSTAADELPASESTPAPLAPDFAVATTAGRFDLATVKTPVLLEIFATWCPHCQRETTVLNDLSRTYRKRIAVIAVSGSPYSDPQLRLPETQSDVDAFVKAFDVQYPVAFDPALTVARLYIGTGYPTIVVIDRRKRISYTGMGEVPPATLEKALDAALAE